jgi:hypothetical protein
VKLLIPLNQIQRFAVSVEVHWKQIYWSRCNIQHISSILIIHEIICFFNLYILIWFHWSFPLFSLMPCDFNLEPNWQHIFDNYGIVYSVKIQNALCRSISTALLFRINPLKISRHFQINFIVKYAVSVVQTRMSCSLVISAYMGWE